MSAYHNYNVHVWYSNGNMTSPG